MEEVVMKALDNNRTALRLNISALQRQQRSLIVHLVQNGIIQTDGSFQVPSGNNNDTFNEATGAVMSQSSNLFSISDLLKTGQAISTPSSAVTQPPSRSDAAVIAPKPTIAPSLPLVNKFDPLLSLKKKFEYGIPPCPPRNKSKTYGKHNTFESMAIVTEKVPCPFGACKKIFKDILDSNPIAELRKVN